jgi:hypothetical protein
MASGKMRRISRKVRRAGKALLQEHLGLTDEEAEDEVLKLPETAFINAVNVAMTVSPTVPVQPDWLVAMTARQFWFLACK